VEKGSKEGQGGKGGQEGKEGKGGKEGQVGKVGFFAKHVPYFQYLIRCAILLVYIIAFFNYAPRPSCENLRLIRTRAPQGTHAG
jgi:hypothetical protein